MQRLLVEGLQLVEAIGQAGSGGKRCDNLAEQVGGRACSIASLQRDQHLHVGVAIAQHMRRLDCQFCFANAAHAADAMHQRTAASL